MTWVGGASSGKCSSCCQRRVVALWQESLRLRCTGRGSGCVGCSAIRISGVRDWAHGGVPVVLIVAAVEPVEDEYRFMLYRGCHENDTPRSFMELLRGVDEFVLALDTTFAVVCSAWVVDGVKVIGSFVYVSVGVRSSEEDHFCCWSEQ